MKSQIYSSSRPSSSRRQKQEVVEQLTLSQILKDFISSDPKMARVMEVDLFMKDYIVSLNFIPETNTWESSFTKHFDAYIRIRMCVNALIAPDNKGIFRVQPFVPSAFSGDEHEVSITILLKIENSKISWEHRSDDGIDILKTKGYERAISISGPFPVQYILNYVDIAKYKLYSHHTGDGSTGPNESILAERDFSVQMIQYMEHLSVTRHNAEIPPVTTGGLGYKPRMHVSTSLLRAESEKIETSPGEVNKSILRRVF